MTEEKTNRELNMGTVSKSQTSEGAGDSRTGGEPLDLKGIYEWLEDPVEWAKKLATEHWKEQKEIAQKQQNITGYDSISEEIFINGLLSSFKTPVVNIISGASLQKPEKTTEIKKKVLGPPKPKKKVLGPPKPNAFQTAVIKSESSGVYDVVNTEGYMGAYQFGDARLKDYKKATGEKFDNKTFIKDKKLQDKVFKWHTNDIKNYITKNKLDSYIGKKINGVLVTWNGLIAVAHLGGNTGMRKFLQSNGKYNPNDAPQNSGSVGTSLTDYLNKFKDSK